VSRSLLTLGHRRRVAAHIALSLALTFTSALLRPALPVARAVSQMTGTGTSRLTLAAATAGVTATPVAGVPATISLDASRPLTAVSPISLGVNINNSDDPLPSDQGVIGYLNSTGLKQLRYPGGSQADEYDWRSNTIVLGSPGGYANASNDYTDTLRMAQNIGAKLWNIVDYGELGPDVAAQWVAQAKADGASGGDWEIGNEQYLGGESNILHGNSHDPSNYVANAFIYAQQMRAADPTIKIAVPVNVDEAINNNYSGWNGTVLAGDSSHDMCDNIDTLDVHPYAQQKDQEDDPTLLAYPSTKIAQIYAYFQNLIALKCLARVGKISIQVGEYNNVTSDPVGRQTMSVVNALFMADDSVSWLEQGVKAIQPWALRNGVDIGGHQDSTLYPSVYTDFGDYGLLARFYHPSNTPADYPGGDTPFPAASAMTMTAGLIGSGGNFLLPSVTGSAMLRAHAVKRSDGTLSVLLENTDRNNAQAATVNITNLGAVASTAQPLTYSEDQAGVPGGVPTQGTLSRVSSSGFSVSLAHYSMVEVVLLPSGYVTPTPTPTYTPLPTATPTATPPGLTTLYGFETSNQGWSVEGGPQLMYDNANDVGGGTGSAAWSGTWPSGGVLRLRENANTSRDFSARPIITANIYVPGGYAGVWNASLFAYDPSYVQQASPVQSLTPGRWTQVSFQLPTGVVTRTQDLGIQINNTSIGGQTVQINIDDIRQQSAAGSTFPTGTPVAGATQTPTVTATSTPSPTGTSLPTSSPSATPTPTSSATPVPGSIAVTSPLALSAMSVSAGGTLSGVATLRNNGTTAVTLPEIVIAARPPGGTYGGGPYDDFGKLQNVTLQPGASVTINEARAFTSADPTGTWDAYLTYEDASGAYHDQAPDLAFNVVAATATPTPTASPTATTSPTATPSPAGGIVVVNPLALAPNPVGYGQTFTGQATIKNTSNTSITLPQMVIALRPPGGTHAGGPFTYDFGARNNVTLAPGQSLTIQGSRTFNSPDPTGTWDAYLTYETSDGAYHDQLDSYFQVSASSTPTSTATPMPSGIVVSAPLTLSAMSVSAGGTLSGAATLRNNGTTPITLPEIVIAARPPGGTHGGGPYDDFGKIQNVTLQPGASVTINEARAFTSADPTGTWDAYLTYEDASGAYHDQAPDLAFSVVAATVTPTPGA